MSKIAKTLAKDLEAYSAVMQSSVLSVNEIRTLEQRWRDAYSKCNQPMAILGEGVTITPLPTNRIKCEYCGRPNDPVREMCASCGAPLQN